MSYDFTKPWWDRPAPSKVRLSKSADTPIEVRYNRRVCPVAEIQILPSKGTAAVRAVIDVWMPEGWDQGPPAEASDDGLEHGID